MCIYIYVLHYDILIVYEVLKTCSLMFNREVHAKSTAQQTHFESEPFEKTVLADLTMLRATQWDALPIAL